MLPSLPGRKGNKLYAHAFLFGNKIMIGSLIFYGLYPLTRFLSKRASEPLKGSPSAVGNGMMGNGDEGVSSSQTALLNTDTGQSTQTGEGFNEQVPRKEENEKTELESREHVRAVVHRETEREILSKNNSEAQSAPEEEGIEVVDGEKYQVQAYKPEDVPATIHNEDLHKVDETAIKPDETTSPVQEQWVKPQNQPAEHTNLEATSPAKEQTHIPTKEESITPTQTKAAEVERWDEDLIPDAFEMQTGACAPGFDLVTLLSESQTYPAECWMQPPQPTWDIPIAPGLTDGQGYPCWHFPSPSYYPTMQQTMPLEVCFPAGIVQPWPMNLYVPLFLPLVCRMWEEVNQGPAASGPVPQAPFEFTVMSYNILAQDLLEANQQLYTHCPLEVLEWNNRHYRLMEEIVKCEADILCLQEVQENHYREQLYPALCEMGYTCVYKRRTRAKTDGCAICYRGDRFSQLSVNRLEFFRPETELLDRDNVGIVLLLRPITLESGGSAKGPPLCVANTHLLYNPGRGDVKLAQLAIMLAEIDHVVNSCRDKGEHCNVILCGDLNSVPHMPLYQLITTGQLYYNGMAAWMISGQEDMSYKSYHRRLSVPLWPSSLGITDNCQYIEETERQSERHIKQSGRVQYDHNFLLQLRFCPVAIVRPLDLAPIPGVTDNTPDYSAQNQALVSSFRPTIRHGLNLCSVYQHTLRGSGYPEVTTLHSEMGATVDYIFYSPTCHLRPYGQRGREPPASRGLKLVGRLSLLSEGDLWAVRGLPNQVFPSDHMNLLAKFQLEVNPV